ncbi:hypothetical protein PGTUg99_006764 [Puccinia graminis f. sp. tritici]|uniref:Uncharacterized protein n=1 Tax=Puccinia graminis f. sp. tritici TaxID=56615 RepID=A0A5B0NSR3_PUCGR|nr:hypothetical protein PGTUg99_006764 [Puccinia graminis f. sp. tritici]
MYHELSGLIRVQHGPDPDRLKCGSLSATPNGASLGFVGQITNPLAGPTYCQGTSTAGYDSTEICGGVKSNPRRNGITDFEPL